MFKEELAELAELRKFAEDEKETKTPKEIATENDEPYVDIISMDVDPQNIHAGAFELDWNDIWIQQLRRAGYQGTEEEDVIDQWLQDICRNIVTETYEKEQAMNPDLHYVKRQNLGDGRTEVS